MKVLSLNNPFLDTRLDEHSKIRYLKSKSYNRSLFKYLRKVGMISAKTSKAFLLFKFDNKMKFLHLSINKIVRKTYLRFDENFTQISTDNFYHIKKWMHSILCQSTCQQKNSRNIFFHSRSNSFISPYLLFWM